MGRVSFAAAGSEVRRAPALRWGHAATCPAPTYKPLPALYLATCRPQARPRAFVLENVYALTYSNKVSHPAYERLLREIAAADYDRRAEVRNAADYGVPKARPRLFVLGVPKEERLPEHLEPTHGGSW